MLKVGEFRDLPSGRGKVAINKTDGTIVIRENHTNGIYMQGSGEIFLSPDDAPFIVDMLLAWMDEGNEIPPPGTVLPR